MKLWTVHTPARHNTVEVLLPVRLKEFVRFVDNGVSVQS